ncbi:hypothetical protein BD324DRAFT_244501 [Kockovaella imperatae]|uniref:Uncharacterized protein n=1 Tax=Kockovaella imperatae TaxID=4999 RepID=A0A1Y1UPK3_9TREE|nr:hypothetical protein BD324DRAFT_244501 [Kockovaella imperatae]ORX39939.1 hypothetical protein BD324DRAFT_244501 [Kockovaella imperatae]
MEVDHERVVHEDEVMDDYPYPTDIHTLPAITLHLPEKQMDLKMGEDDLNLQSITLLELAQLHHGCGLSPPLELFVSFEPGRFYQRFTAIQKEVSAQAKESDESVDGKSEPDANGPIPRSVPQSTVKAEGRETLVDQSKRGNPAEFRQARPGQYLNFVYRLTRSSSSRVWWIADRRPR